MASSITRAAGAAGLTAADHRAAADVLGHGHALTRAVGNLHTLAPQSAVSILAVAAAIVGVVLHVRHATLALCVAAGICGVFLLAWAAARGLVHDRARDLIATGRDGLVLAVVTRERRRLVSPKERERLARALEGFHRDALRWHQLLPQFRPPHGVAQLRNVTPEVEAVTSALRGERVRAQGVVLTVRLMCDGHRSPLYANELGPLREELNRIRYLLQCTDRADDELERRAA
jgi:hypothetical protein